MRFTHIHPCNQMKDITHITLCVSILCERFFYSKLVNLEGREEPRSEKPLVRVSSSGMGLLGVKSTSSPSP